MKKYFLAAALIAGLAAGAVFAQEQQAQQGQNDRNWGFTFNAELSAFMQVGGERSVGFNHTFPRVWLGFHLGDYASVHTQFRALNRSDEQPFINFVVHEAYIDINPLGLFGANQHVNFNIRAGLIEFTANYHSIFTTFNPTGNFSFAQSSDIRNFAIEGALGFNAIPLTIRWISDLDMSIVDRNTNPPIPGSHYPSLEYSFFEGWFGMIEANLEALRFDAFALSANIYSQWRLNEDTFATWGNSRGRGFENFIGGSLRLDLLNLPVNLAVGVGGEFIQQEFRDDDFSDPRWGFAVGGGFSVGLPDMFNVRANFSQTISEESWMSDVYYFGNALSVVGLDIDFLGLGWIRPFASVGALLVLSDLGEEMRPDWFSSNAGELDRIAWAIGVDIPIPVRFGSLNVITGWQRGDMQFDNVIRGFEFGSGGMGTYYLTIRARF